MFKTFGFAILFCFWILLSGKFDGFHLSLGIISCLIVIYWTEDLLFERRDKGIASRLKRTPQFFSYIVWLSIQILMANLSVIYLALHPRMAKLISPRIVRFKTRLKSDFSKVILANSITLTPGTITVRIEDGEFIVHAISEKIAEGMPGEMERRIAVWLGEDD